VQRRYFLKSGVALAVAAELGASKWHGLFLAHNWAKYDFGSGPTVTDQGVPDGGALPCVVPCSLLKQI